MFYLTLENTVTQSGKIINSKVKTLVGKAGDVWAWHGCLLHGTNFNAQGNKPRFSLRLIFKQTKNTNSIINKLNKKIQNTVALKKMFLGNRFKNNKKKFMNISKYS